MKTTKARLVKRNKKIKVHPPPPSPFPLNTPRRCLLYLCKHRFFLPICARFLSPTNYEFLAQACVQSRLKPDIACCSIFLGVIFKGLKTTKSLFSQSIQNMSTFLLKHIVYFHIKVYRNMSNQYFISLTYFLLKPTVTLF